VTPARAATTLGAEPPRGWLRGVLFDNAGLKVLSLILALTVYLLVNTDEKREISARVRVAYVLPPGKALVSEHVDEVRVSIRGPWRRIKRFDEREIDRIDLDLSSVPDGEIAITPEMIHLPRGLEITSIQPRVVRVALEDIAQKQMPIQPTIAGRPLHGYQVQLPRTIVDPPMVAVRGAARLIRALDAVRTQEVRVDGRNDHFTVATQIVTPQGVELVDPGPGQVQVSVSIDEELVTRRLGLLPVAVRVESAPGQPAPDLGKWTVVPSQVEVVLTGNLLAIERFSPTIAATVTLSSAAVAAARAGGSIEVPVVVEGAPGVGVRVTPDKLKLVPRK
jgi:YbbR domain-containing protein